MPSPSAAPAYVSLQQGDPQVFVSPVPVEGPGKQVSIRGGRCPRWNRDADELYFSTSTGNLMMVSITSTGSDIEVGKPVFLYDSVSTTTGWPNQPFDAAPDGQRFLVIKDDPSNPAERPELKVVDHWIDEIETRLADRQ